MQILNAKSKKEKNCALKVLTMQKKKNRSTLTSLMSIMALCAKSQPVREQLKASIRFAWNRWRRLGHFWPTKLASYINHKWLDIIGPNLQYFIQRIVVNRWPKLSLHTLRNFRFIYDNDATWFRCMTFCTVCSILVRRAVMNKTLIKLNALRTIARIILQCDCFSSVGFFWFVCAVRLLFLINLL